jgi:hypothetical protein
MVFMVSDCTWQTFSQHRRLSEGRDSVMGVATCYGLDGPVNESWLRLDFLRPSRPAVRPTHPPVQWEAGLFLGGKANGAWR